MTHDAKTPRADNPDGAKLTVESAHTEAIATDGAVGHRSGADGEPIRTIRIDAGKRRLSRATLAELVEYREVLGAFTVRFVKVKYKQALIGVGWAVVQPVLAAALFALIFGRWADLPSDGSPFLLFALAGMTGWTYFSTATNVAAQSLVTDETLLRKVYFPREVIPLAAVGAGLVDFGPALIVLLGVAILYGSAPAVSWLLLPVAVLVLILIATAAGLFLSAINVYYRDVKHALPFLLQLGLFASAIIFPLSLIESPWDTVYGIINPVVAGVEALRAIVIDGDWPDPVMTGGAIAWGSILLVGAYAVFKKLERQMGDRV
jgi:lipopolysaccharide transport system permease protein